MTLCFSERRIKMILALLGFLLYIVVSFISAIFTLFGTAAFIVLVYLFVQFFR